MKEWLSNLVVHNIIAFLCGWPWSSCWLCCMPGRTHLLITAKSSSTINIFLKPIFSLSLYIWAYVTIPLCRAGAFTLTQQCPKCMQGNAWSGSGRNLIHEISLFVNVLQLHTKPKPWIPSVQEAQYQRHFLLHFAHFLLCYQHLMHIHCVERPP